MLTWFAVQSQSALLLTEAQVRTPVQPVQCNARVLPWARHGQCFGGPFPNIDSLQNCLPAAKTSCRRVHRNSVANCTLATSQSSSPVLHISSAATTTSFPAVYHPQERPRLKRFLVFWTAVLYLFRPVAPSRVVPSRSGRPSPSRSSSSVARHLPTPSPIAQPHRSFPQNRRSFLRRLWPFSSSRDDLDPRVPATRPSHGYRHEAASRHQENRTSRS